MVVHPLYINGLVYRIKQFMLTVLLCVVSTVIEPGALYIPNGNNNIYNTKYIYKTIIYREQLWSRVKVLPSKFVINLQ